jgi:hypothetical protein
MRAANKNKAFIGEFFPRKNKAFFLGLKKVDINVLFPSKNLRYFSELYITTHTARDQAVWHTLYGGIELEQNKNHFSYWTDSNRKPARNR